MYLVSRWSKFDSGRLHAAWLGCCVFGAGFAAKYAEGLASRRARLWRFRQRDPRGRIAWPTIRSERPYPGGYLQ